MNVSNATSQSATAVPAAAGQSALGSLGSNFNDFLNLLMTQLKNQDPTSPLDTNQFTSQLVQFTSVEQQINTNTSLNTLIQATQGANLLQSSSLVGQDVEVSGDQLSLQNGHGTVSFQTPTSEPVSIGIYSSAGTKLRDATITSNPGSNSWNWDGADAAGNALPDGPYRVIAVRQDGSAVPFTTRAIATGVQRTADGMKVQLGGLNVDFSAVQSIGAQ